MGLPALIPVEESDPSNIIVNYFKITPSQIRQYIPDCKAIRERICFKILVVISVHPRCTKTFISELIISNLWTTEAAIDHLHTLGLIALQKKPRRITQLKVWKVEKIWVITPKGKNVLNALLKGIDEKKPVAYWTDPKVR